MPKVSIIMGAYNCEATLEDSINSILNQTFIDWEFVICDDASDDSTLSILESYKNKYPKKFVLLHNDKNLMLAGSLNRCLSVAKGEYIARMDADDISAPDRLEKQVDYLEHHPECSVVGTYMQAFNENGFDEIIPNILNPTKYDLPKTNAFHHATIMMRKSVYDDLGGYTVAEHTRRVEDVDLWFRFFKKGYQGHTIAQPLYLVRVDEDAYKRRRFKYCLDASRVLLYGIKMLDLPAYNYIYVLKPIVSYFTPKAIKTLFRNNLQNK